MQTLDEWMKEAFDYWEGAFAFVPEDAPDGAWFQMHIDIADSHLREYQKTFTQCGFGAPPEGTDSHDLVMAYLNITSEIQDL
jgi:hypothetical protein